jgi:DNA mismatch repair protein MSH6
MSSRDTASTDSLKQKSLTSFFSKAPAVGCGSKAPKTPGSIQKSATSASSASNAKYKSNIPRSLSEIDPPKTPESRLTDLRALNSSAADSTRSVTWSHKAGSTPPTSDPIPIEQDEDEDVVMLSSEGNHVTSIKSVSIFLFKSREDAETVQSTRNKRKVVIDDSDDDDSEAQSNARRIATFRSSSPTDAIRSTGFFYLNI